MLCMFLFASIAVSNENKGAATLVLQGGSDGNISFPHHRHQNTLGSCNPCHNLFPQTPGSIEKNKAEGKLKKKEVMEQCRTCHRQKTDNGEKAGPINCKGCHRK